LNFIENYSRRDPQSFFLKKQQQDCHVLFVVNKVEKEEIKYRKAREGTWKGEKYTEEKMYRRKREYYKLRLQTHLSEDKWTGQSTSGIGGGGRAILGGLVFRHF